MAFLLWSSVADLDIQQRTPSEKRRVSVCGLPLCGAAWQAARRLATAAVRCQRGIWPLDNRPKLAKLPHKSPRCLAYTYARIQAVLLMNRLGVHLRVAHPFPRGKSSSTE